MANPLASQSAGPSSSWLDRQCDQFEKAWQQGNSPRIEDSLSSLPAEQHRTLLRELLGIELELRHRRGDQVQRSEYASRFPDSVDLLDEFRDSFVLDADATQSNADLGTTPSSATTAARYRDLRLFRRGGLGALYRAFDESLHRETVVKFMNDDCQSDPALMAQFRVEAEITSRLDHPGIVPVYGLGQDWHGRPFYVMRLINGRELKQAIAEYHQAGGPGARGTKNRNLLLNLLEHLTSACNTVAYAHHVGIMHCDLKPANIMIGKYGETFVLDWGLATSFERSSTFFVVNEPTMRPHSSPGGSSSGHRGGTYGYISPEQLLGEGSLGPTSDVYSLGATLYEILTGRPPFNARDKDVLEKVRTGRFAAPRGVQPGVPRRLEAICLKAMNVVPTARYPTAKHLASDLTNWMRDEEIDAAPDGWTGRVSRFFRRHRGLTAAVFVVSLTLVVAAGWIDRSRKIAAHNGELLTAEIEKGQFAKQAADSQARLEAMQKVSFTRALNTFENLCRPLAYGEMNNLDTFQPIIDEIKDFAALYLQSFEKTDEMRWQTGRVYELRGAVDFVRDREQAIKDYERAEQCYTTVTPRPGEEFEHEMRLAHVCVSRGRLLVQGDRFDEALRVLESAVKRLEHLRSEHGKDRSLLRELAEARHHLGELFLDRAGTAAKGFDNLETAEDHFDLSKDLREDLVATSTGEEKRNHIRDLARSFGYLGDLYLAQGIATSASQSYEKSLELRKGLYDRNKTDPENRFQYARGLTNFGDLELGYLGELPLAIERLQKAVEIQESLADDLKYVDSIQRDLASTNKALGELYLLTAQLQPQRAEDFGKLARDAAGRAKSQYAALHAANGKEAAGLAASLVLRAALDAATDPPASLQAAQDAQGLLKSAVEELRPKDELTTLAMARSLHGDGEGAWQTLKLAIEHGENGVVRLERHREVAFKALVQDAGRAAEFDAACKKIRESLTLP